MFILKRHCQKSLLIWNLSKMFFPTFKIFLINRINCNNFKWKDKGIFSRSTNMRFLAVLCFIWLRKKTLFVQGPSARKQLCSSTSVNSFTVLLHNFTVQPLREHPEIFSFLDFCSSEKAVEKIRVESMDGAKFHYYYYCFNWNLKATLVQTDKVENWQIWGNQ